MRAERDLFGGVGRSERSCCFLACPGGADANVLVAEVREPVCEGARGEDRRELGRERVLIVVVLAVREVDTIEELAQPLEELRLERPDREVATVRRRVDPVAREPAGEHARNRLAAEAVRDEIVRPMRHRDDDPRAVAGSRTLEEPGQDLRDGAERTGREVGDLHRWELCVGVLEDACPAEVVEVVTGAQPMALVVQPKPVIEQ